MMSYPINELERLTGIKAHTIRIWEKRYGLITPDRTDTNRRSYNDDQVRKLLNVSTLLAQGQKISKIAALSESELHDLIQGEPEAVSADHIREGFINDLVKSMLAFDEVGFEKTLAAAITRYGMTDAMLGVIYPFLHKTGLLWSINKAAPVQEHFASSIVCRKLMAATDGLLPPSDDGKKFLLFLPALEWHEIGLLFANYIIKAKGHKTYYLGQNVPFENIEIIVPIVEPDYMLLFYVAPRPKEEITAQLKMLAGVSKKTHLLVGGNPEVIVADKSTAKQMTHLAGIHTLLGYL